MQQPDYTPSNHISARHSMFVQSHITSYDTNPDVKRPMLTVRVCFNRFSAFVRLALRLTQLRSYGHADLTDGFDSVLGGRLAAGYR